MKLIWHMDGSIELDGTAAEVLAILRPASPTAVIEAAPDPFPPPPPYKRVPGCIADKLLDVMEARPDRVFRIAELANLISEDPRKIRTPLNRLARSPRSAVTSTTWGCYCWSTMANTALTPKPRLQHALRARAAIAPTPARG